MQAQIIFLPMLLHMLLVILLYVRLGKMKQVATERGEVDLTRRTLHEDAWPDYVVKINNNIHNQFEVPMLFYGLTFIYWALEFVNGLVLLLSFVFVLSRFYHSYIHTGKNDVVKRRKVFTFGCYIIILQLALAFNGFVISFI